MKIHTLIAAFYFLVCGPMGYAQVGDHIIDAQLDIKPYTRQRSIAASIFINNEMRGVIRADGTGFARIKGHIKGKQGDNHIQIKISILSPAGYVCLMSNPIEYFEGQENVIPIRKKEVAFQYFKESGILSRENGLIDSSNIYFKTALENAAYVKPQQQLELAIELSYNYDSLGLFSQALETLKQVGVPALRATSVDDRKQFFSCWTIAYNKLLRTGSQLKSDTSSFGELVASKSTFLGEWDVLMATFEASGLAARDSVLTGLNKPRTPLIINNERMSMGAVIR